MNAMNQTTLAALENQAFALMARMHVILRRHNGRVTDIEYMRVDPAYCRHLLGMAAALPNADLREICEKLDQVYFGEEGLFVRARSKPPLIARLGAVVQPATERHEMQAVAAAPVPIHAIPVKADVDRAYIGRLR